MIRKKNGDIEWLEFELLQEHKSIDFRVFLRHGGVSRQPFDSLNFGLSAGDSAQSVRANLDKIIPLIDCPKVISTRQVHGNEIAIVSKESQNDAFVSDGLMTNVSCMPLLIKHADCQAACFYDPVQHAMSVVHCGWRGNVQNIYLETIMKMHKEYGSNPADLLVCISPSLGPERSEFINYKLELSESFYPFQFKSHYFDLWAISEWQLIQAGVLPHHIQMARICTWKNPADYFSYRRATVTGCHASLGLLKNPMLERIQAPIPD